MAERIGSAYVRVFFRSSGDDLDDQVKKDKSFKKAGESAARQAGEGFNSEWTDAMRQRMKDDEKFNKQRTTVFKTAMTKLRNDLNKFWKEEGESIQKGMGRPLDDLDRDLIKMRDRFGQIKANLPDLLELSHQSEDVNKRWGALEATFRDVAGWAASVGSEVGGIGDESDGSMKKLNTNFDGFFNKLRAGWTSAREEQRKTDKENGGFFKKWEGRSDRFGDKLSKIFGKGWRNNFANVVGLTVAGITSIFPIALKGLGQLQELFSKDAVKPLEESATAAEGLGSQLAGLAAMAPELGIALGIAFVGLPLLLGTIASLIMLVTGAVIALAAALAFALVGAVAVAAAALVPLAAAVGVGILAFKNMSKEAKSAFSDVKDSFTDLGKTASEHLFKNAAADAKLLEGALDGVNGVVAGIADALRTVGEGWLKALNGPGAKKFMAFLGDVLPGMIIQIGRIVGNLGTFFAEAFVGVTPLLQDFLGWLTGVTQSMADLGKGKGGGKIGDFFKDIAPTMQSVGDAIGQVIGLIFDLFEGPGQKAGGDMFQSLADNVQKFRDFLKQAKKDGSLKEFFDDAKKFAGALGNAVIAVGKLIAALDDPTTRKILIWMVERFTDLVNLITGFVHMELRLAHALGQVWQAIKKAFGAALDHGADAWHAVAKAAQRAWQAVKNAWSNVGSWFSARWHAISQAAQTAWNNIKAGAANLGTTIRNRVNDIVAWFQGIPGRIGGIASHFGQLAGDWASAVMNRLRSLPGDIIGLFEGLAGRVVNAIGNINLTPHINWPDPPSWLKKVTPGLATGGLVFHETLARIGERGPEAVVPLTGPLSAVDPAVRALAAFARGESGGQITTRGGKTIDIGGITLITPTQDANAVAQQVVNRIAAASYI